MILSLATPFCFNTRAIAFARRNEMFSFNFET